MKFKIKKIHVILIIVLLIAGGFIYYNSIIFRSINTNKFNDLAKSKGTNIIYIGRDTCSGCTEVKPILEEVLKSNNLKAYYYDTDKAKNKEYDNFKECINNFEVETIPLIICYKDGKEVDRFDYEDFEKSKDNSIGMFIQDITTK